MLHIVRALLCLNVSWKESGIRPNLTLCMLNFSEGTKTYIYILCHCSTLIRHRAPSQYKDRLSQVWGFPC